MGASWPPWLEDRARVRAEVRFPKWTVTPVPMLKNAKSNLKSKATVHSLILGRDTLTIGTCPSDDVGFLVVL